MACTCVWLIVFFLVDVSAMAMEEDGHHVIKVQLLIRQQALAQQVSKMFSDMFQIPSVPDDVWVLVRKAEQDYQVFVQNAEQHYQASYYCFEAIDLLKQAVLMCKKLWKRNSEYEQHDECMHLLVIKVELKELTNKIRDSLILRTQNRVQMGERESFEHELVDQHGGQGFNKDEWSQLMHSYAKEIRNKFPEVAFAPRRPHKRRRRRAV